MGNGKRSMEEMLEGVGAGPEGDKIIKNLDVFFDAKGLPIRAGFLYRPETDPAPDDFVYFTRDGSKRVLTAHESGCGIVPKSVVLHESKDYYTSNLVIAQEVDIPSEIRIHKKMAEWLEEARKSITGKPTAKIICVDDLWELIKKEETSFGSIIKKLSERGFNSNEFLCHARSPDNTQLHTAIYLPGTKLGPGDYTKFEDELLELRRTVEMYPQHWIAAPYFAATPIGTLEVVAAVFRECGCEVVFEEKGVRS